MWEQDNGWNHHDNSDDWCCSIYDAAYDGAYDGAWDAITQSETDQEEDNGNGDWWGRD